MLKTSCGPGPDRLLPLYDRYVPMRDPKNMQSDPRKIHMPTFRWSSPVFPRLGSWWWTACVASACSAKTRLLVTVPGGGPVMLDRELVHEHQGQEAAHDDLIHA